jgi:hypothetical protein
MTTRKVISKSRNRKALLLVNGAAFTDGRLSRGYVAISPTEKLWAANLAELAILPRKVAR